MKSLPVPLVPTVVLATVLAACAAQPTADEESPQPVAYIAGLLDGWNVVEPGGDTKCSDGSPYRFFVRPGDPGKLAFYLQGGGGCWSGATCDPDLQPSYQMTLEGTDPGQAHGMFAFDESANPFADHSVVMAPYCSGDVHIGNRTTSYEAPSTAEHEAHEVTVHHLGAVNAQAALDWTYEHFFRPASIFVTGSSAGSIPSPFYAVKLAAHYPSAAVTALGDGSGGYRDIFANVRTDETWGTRDVLADDLPYFRDLAQEDFSFARIYVAAAQANADIRLASYDTAEDDVQLRFQAAGGNPVESLQPLLDANLAEIRGAVPGFASYVAGGPLHTILLRPEMYTYTVGDEPFIDWLTALEQGAPVGNVHCGESCAEPELLETTSEATPETTPEAMTETAPEPTSETTAGGL